MKSLYELVAVLTVGCFLVSMIEGNYPAAKLLLGGFIASGVFAFLYDIFDDEDDLELPS